MSQQHSSLVSIGETRSNIEWIEFIQSLTWWRRGGGGGWGDGGERESISPSASAAVLRAGSVTPQLPSFLQISTGLTFISVCEPPSSSDESGRSRWNKGRRGRHFGCQRNETTRSAWMEGLKNGDSVFLQRCTSVTWSDTRWWRTDRQTDRWDIWKVSGVTFPVGGGAMASVWPDDF